MKTADFAAYCAVGCAVVYTGLFVVSVIAGNPEPLMLVVVIVLVSLAWVSHVLTKAMETVKVQREVIDAQADLINAMLPLLGISEGRNDE